MWRVLKRRASCLNSSLRLDCDVERFFQLQRAFPNLVPDGLAFKKGHGDEGLAVNFIDFVDGANVGVIERGGRLRLAKETLLVLFVFEHFGAKEFQGNKAF